tara:strand:- start:288 stop:1040 length:753 start_codon:yes stop_codon:yes gene_type:complete
MKSITKELKHQLTQLDSIEERLNLLKDKYKGETAYLVTCGPSLTNHDENILMGKLSDKLVLSIKQAHDVVGDISDFHLLNTYNLKDYNYTTNDSVVVWSVSKSYAQNQLERIQHKPLDIYFPVINPPYITPQDTIAGSCNFDDMKLLGNRCEVTWGPGMFYEMMIPLCLHLGVKNIVTIGWDLKVTDKHEHFYNEKMNCKPQDGELQQAINSTKPFYEWCELNNINIKIISEINRVDDRFKRIKLEDIDA